VSFARVKVQPMCGESWFGISGWKQYGLFGTYPNNGIRVGSLSMKAFRIGPILFWNGK
jgi:hypothetical protein